MAVVTSPYQAPQKKVSTNHRCYCSTYCYLVIGCAMQQLMTEMTGPLKLMEHTTLSDLEFISNKSS
uniref:Uncharacterized protein n=1 Tax=Anguilla anguilla TaxID=7936 RepID=A0A0E9PIF7_ANGAN